MSTDVDIPESVLIAKRQIVADLKAMLNTKLAASDEFECKATEIFKFSSSVLGIVAGLGISTSAKQNVGLVVCFVLLLIIYLIHVYCIYEVMRPRTYSLSPGIPHLVMTWDAFYESYITVGENGYLDQMISDLGGIDKKPGAIEDAEIHNTKKAQFFQWSGATFVVLIAILLVMATISLVSG